MHNFFKNGSQSIVSLINLTQEKNFFGYFSNGSSAANTPFLGPSTPSIFDLNRNNNDANACDNNTINSNSKNKTKLSPKNVENDVTLLNNNESEEADEESVDMNNSQQTVQVDGNPFHICLSSTNLDQSLIEYLQQHPTTKMLVNIKNFFIKKLDIIGINKYFLGVFRLIIH